MLAASLCPVCGKPLSASAPDGLCSSCLLSGLLEVELSANPHDPTPDAAVFPGPQASEVIGDYELLELLGRGGMGVVWRARQRSLKRIVALKLIRTGEFADLDEIRRFRNEAEAVALLDHPNIVPIYEIGEDAGRHYFSMRLMEGGSLANPMLDTGCSTLGEEKDSSKAKDSKARYPASSIEKPISRIAALVAKVARAVHYAHQRGLLHRDLKPANILLDAEGEPLVADFGLARRLGIESSLTGSNDVLGSPAFMAPEQATSRSDAVTTAADTYSLGAILFQLVTGRPPFQGATPLDTLRQVVDNEPPRPRSLNPAIDRDLETICLKCLAKNPVGRYTAAAELAEDLERWRRGDPIRARPVKTRELALKWARRHPAATAFISLTILAPVIIIAVLLVMEARVSRERDYAQRQAEITRQNLYAVDISLAYHALETDDYDMAWQSLVAHRPLASPSNPQTSLSALTVSSLDLRGFEWRWLWQRAQGEARHNVSAHLGWVNTIAYSPDGRFAATASDDGTTKLWDAVQEKCLFTFAEPGNPVRRTYTDRTYEAGNHSKMYSASFSRDSRTLLTGSESLRLWDVNSGRCLWSFKTNGYDMAVFSPADPNLALVNPEYPRNSLGLLDAASPSLAVVFTNGRADAICFTPNGQQFARWDRDARRISLQKIPSGELVASFDATGIYAWAMAFSPDGRTLAACNMEKGQVELFDVVSQRKSQPLPGHGRRLWALAFSPNGRWLASGGNDQTIQLWDLDSRREVRQLRGHRAGVQALAFSPDGSRLASGGYDGTVRFWDMAPPEPPPTLSNVFGAFSFSSDGGWLVTQNNSQKLSLWELSTRCVRHEWEAPGFQSAVFTTNGDLLTASVSTSSDPPCLRAFSFHALKAKGSTSKVQSSDSNVRDSNPPGPISTGNTSTVLTGITSRCTSIALSPNGELTVTGHRDGTVAFWDSPSGHLLHSTQGAFLGMDRKGTNEDVQGVAFSFDGHTVGAATSTRVCVNTWELPRYRQIGNRHFGERHALPMAISPNGRQLAIGGVGQGLTINLWDRALLGPPEFLRGHQDFLFAVAYSPDGRTLASGGRDGLLKLWHLPTNRQVGTVLALPKDAKFAQITFSPDGTWLGVSDTTGTLHLWHALPLAELDAAADAETVNR